MSARIEEVSQATCTTRDIAIVGAAAGLTAGVVMATWAVLTSVWHGLGLMASFESIGATFLGPNATNYGLFSILYGMLVHGLTAAALGVFFCALLPPNATSGHATAAGLGFGVAVLLAMTFIITPVANPVLRHTVSSIPKSWVIQHILFGITLGLVPGYWRIYRDAVRDRLESHPFAVMIRPARLPAPPRVASHPRIARARVALRRAELMGPPRKRHPATMKQAAS